MKTILAVVEMRGRKGRGSQSETAWNEDDQESKWYYDCECRMSYQAQIDGVSSWSGLASSVVVVCRATVERPPRSIFESPGYTLRSHLRILSALPELERVTAPAAE